MASLKTLPVALIFAGLLPGAGNAQVQLPRPPQVGTDSVVVAADSAHAAGPVHRFFFGSGYRDLWVKPITVPVLDLGRFDGGLRATEVGGGMQTRSLRLENAEGREWVFRSVAKDARSLLPKDLRNSFLAGIVNDQISHAHPGGALVVPPLASALGILHAQPQLAIMPDDPRLGEYREEFAGMLGIIEEFADDLPDGKPGFAGSEEVVNSLDLLEELREKPSVRVDAREFLKARLLDLLINDWDRHKDQWRWARLEREDRDYWIPVPRDRDNALFWFDGLLPSLARFAAPKLIPFGSQISLKGLTVSSRELDHVLLAPLDSAQWDSITSFVTERLTDSLIIAAEARIPPEYRPEREELVAGRLISRRDGLAHVSRQFYRKLAQVVDIHATDDADRALVEYEGNGAVTVELSAGKPSDADATYFRRRFLPHETSEVRVYLHGGEDSTTVRGAPTAGIVVRVIGGMGTNVAAGERLALARLYEFPSPQDEITYGPDTLFDRRPWRVEDGDTLPPRPDRGGNSAPIVDLRYYSDLGLVTSVGMNMYRYAFRTWPYARRTTLELDHAGAPADTRLRLATEFRSEGGGLIPAARVMASGLELTRWYGPGNETARTAEGKANRIEHGRYAGEIMLGVPLLRGVFELGPAAEYARTEADQPAFFGGAPYGTGNFGIAGARARFRIDSRDESHDAPAGLFLVLEGNAWPALWDADEAFGSVSAEARTWIRPPLPLEPVLALRAGGKKLMGTWPFHHSAFLGGVSTLRGYDEQRFAGEAMAFGGAELRLTLFRLPLLPLDLGVHSLAEAGRVWVDGEDSDDWHGAVGGGFSLALDQPAGLLSVTLADGEERTGVYIELGFTF
ncbi:MAG TPA: BamA/TamA family outer membrane protein [Gemmatimonadales bacterium]|nr:BamA/TamA family outer membrane protein [Gemmatimonadales bacterium]